MINTFRAGPTALSKIHSSPVTAWCQANNQYILCNGAPSMGLRASYPDTRGSLPFQQGLHQVIDLVTCKDYQSLCPPPLLVFNITLLILCAGVKPSWCAFACQCACVCVCVGCVYTCVRMYACVCMHLCVYMRITPIMYM